MTLGDIGLFVLRISVSFLLVTFAVAVIKELLED